MAYREPGVQVAQEFEEALPGLALFDLPNVVVGPVFEITEDDDVGTYDGTLTDYTYVSQTAGSIIDTRDPDSTDLTERPVQVDLEDAVVELYSRSGTGDVAAPGTTFTDPTGSAFADNLVGDVIVITAGSNIGSFTIRTITDDNTVETNEAFAATEATISYTVERNIGTVNIVTSTAGVVVADDKVTLPAGLTWPVTPFGAIAINSATVLLSYRALRLEKSADVAEYKRVSELQADFGLDQIIPENQAVFGAFLALNNGTDTVNLLALPRDLLDPGDELLAYSNAFAVLALTDMYAISVMTQNTAVHTALKAHVELYSEPDNKLERVGIINRKIVLTSVVVSEATTGGAEGVDAGGTVFTHAAAAFITDGVVPGHYIEISDPAGAVGRFEIASVDSQTQVTLADTVSGGPHVGVTYEVEKDLSKKEQAETIGAFAASVGSRRVVLTWPDEVKIPVGNSIRTLPGFFLNVSVGALTTGLPTQQGLTNFTVAVYSEVVHSTKYFDRDQLNILGDNGVMVFVQDVLGVTALRIRHQLTTDRSAVKFQEYSVTKNVDFIAKFLRSNHEAANFIGQYNITDNTLDDLKTFAQRNIDFLKNDTRRPKIGGVIEGGTLIEITPDEVNIDSVKERYKFDIPIPLNNLDITIVV